MTLQTPAFLMQLTVYAHVLGSVRIVCRAGSMQLSGVRLSMSVWVSVPSGRWTPLLQVCCCGSGGHEISVDCCSSGLRRANVGSATLSAYVVAEHRLVTFLLSLLSSAAALRVQVRYEWFSAACFHVSDDSASREHIAADFIDAVMRCESTACEQRSRYWWRRNSVPNWPSIMPLIGQ